MLRQRGEMHPGPGALAHFARKYGNAAMLWGLLTDWDQLDGIKARHREVLAQYETIRRRVLTEDREPTEAEVSEAVDLRRLLDWIDSRAWWRQLAVRACNEELARARAL